MTSCLIWNFNVKTRSTFDFRGWRFQWRALFLFHISVFGPVQNGRQISFFFQDHVMKSVFRVNASQYFLRCLSVTR